jgi:integrase
LNQVQPNTPAGLRLARRARITRVRGKGKTERTVFLSADARLALADYQERERPHDLTETTTALFLSAKGIPARSVDGRLAPRAINRILEQIGRWHDGGNTTAVQEGRCACFSPKGMTITLPRVPNGLPFSGAQPEAGA